jgi:ATP-dependent RNA helicase CshB
MGVIFHDADIQDGDWIDIDERNKRKNRKKQASPIDVKAKTMVRKSTKVKPGYKKKHQRETEEFKRKQRRISKRQK